MLGATPRVGLAPLQVEIVRRYYKDMSREILSRLYWACSEESQHWQPGNNLGELYLRYPETGDEAAKLLESLRAVLDAKQADQATGIFYNAAIEYEKQGFVNGVRFGVLLAEELFAGDTV